MRSRSPGLGLLLAFVGRDPWSGETRFTFGSWYLRDGLAVVPVMLGLFSFAEVMALGASERQTVSGRTRQRRSSGAASATARRPSSHTPACSSGARSSGTVVGIIPGVGGTVASFLAYGHAVQGATDRSRFGHGDIRGVIAPEAAHDAKDGGSLVPVLAFGIPGSEGTSVLMAALVLHGLAPGRELMSAQLPLVFVLIWSLFLSNWITSIAGLALVGPLAGMTVLRVQVIAPVIAVLASVGAYLYRQRVEDVVLAVAFGAVGYYMKKLDWPRIPLVIALLLGGAFEVNLHITTRLFELGRFAPETRPVFLALVALTLLNVLWPRINLRRAVPERRS